MERCKKSLWKSAARYATMARMEPSTFGLQAAGAGGDLPEEWQALLASQVSTLAALLSRLQQAPAARVPALAAEAEQVLTTQAQERRGLGTSALPYSGS